MPQVQEATIPAVLGRQLPTYRALGGALLYLAYAVCEEELKCEQSKDDNLGRGNRSLDGKYCSIALWLLSDLAGTALVHGSVTGMCTVATVAQHCVHI